MPEVLGEYELSAVTGSIAAAAATKILFYARNASTSVLARIKRVEITGVIATTAFAVGQMLYTLHVARAFSAENASPGGTALTITGNTNQLRTNMPATALAVVRIASSASLATPAAWTLDDNAIGTLNSHTSGGVGAATPIIGNQFVPNNGVLFDSPCPIILGANEGVAIQVVVPATGVWIAGVRMRWDEVNPY